MSDHATKAKLTFRLPRFILRNSLAPYEAILDNMVLGIRIDAKIKITQPGVLPTAHGPADVTIMSRQTLAKKTLCARAYGLFQCDVEYERRVDILLGRIGSHSARDTDSPARAILVLHKVGREVNTKFLVANGL